jgi:hypothetical protein
VGTEILGAVDNVQTLAEHKNQVLLPANHKLHSKEGNGRLAKDNKGYLAKRGN